MPEDEISFAINAINNKIQNIEVKYDEPLKYYTSFKIGGPVHTMIFPDNSTDLTTAFNIMKDHGITPLILGNGTNILASEKHLNLAVINTSKLTGISLTGSEGSQDISVEAGVLLSKLAVFTYEKSLTGLEFAHGIPGTLGGAIVMNAGAYGSEMRDVVYTVTVCSEEAGRLALTAEDSGFSYRQSRFSKAGDVVLSSIIRLKHGDKEKIKQKMDELSIRRRESQPLDHQSAGSTFKRPKEGYAAALIEHAGLKGFAVGGAQVSEKHSGFVVNKGNATFTDVMSVIEHVQEEVLKRSGVQLELEIKIVK